MKNKHRRRLKPIPCLLLVLILTIFGFLIYKGVSKKSPTLKKEQQNNIINKLSKLDYKKDEIEDLQDELSDENINFLVSKEIKRDDFIDIYNDKYYIDQYMTKYIEYKSKHNDYSSREIVERVNTHADEAFYTNTEASNEKLDKFVIANKHYYLSSSYTAPDLIEFDPLYSLYGATYKNELSEEAMNHFIELFNQAISEGYGIKINSAYRSYQTQNKLYNNYVSSDGVKLADTYSARPGYSEHQTGYAFDVRNVPNTKDDFEDSKEFDWMQENAHKYGFFLRFPKGKEEITGYQYESWHYRYCGIECATYIHDTKITFEEYYEYFIRYHNPRNIK